MTTEAAADPRRFRDTVGLFATGVAVIVALAEDETLAMTANAVTSVSLDPMLVMFCPGKRTKLAQSVANISAFSINFLRHEQDALSTYFAGGWKDPQPPPFRFVPCRRGVRLEGALATIVCGTEHVREAGDHLLVLGRVIDLHHGIPPHRPLLFFGGRYRALDFTESTPAPDLSDVHDEPAHVFYDRWQKS